MTQRNDNILKLLADADYKGLLEELRNNIKSTRISLARRLNEGVMQLYWNIGKAISERKISEGYGSANMLSFYNTFSVAEQKTATTCRSFAVGTYLVANEQVGFA